ncbi:MAG: GMC family oxidoreductase [Dehalococcoidia bacterium]|nr:MAG: GMC family oxidoreductase [Dehalococcoidia bacterium]
MVHELMRKQADVAVVGSGPGGATVARQLARAGKKVVLLEMGRDHRNEFYYGTHLGAMIYGDNHGLLFTEEGLNIIRPIMTGGATNLFAGSAAAPPAWLKDTYKVDIDRYVDETIEELDIQALPDELLGQASKRIMEAGISLGCQWEPLIKFIRPARAAKFDCGAKCMLGCRCGAKWTANEYVDDAVAAGCELITQSKVDELIIEDKQVLGVKGSIKKRIPFEVRARAVVLAAGGIGTPLIMQNSGFFDAGNGIAMDTTTMVYGVSKYKGNAPEPPMTVAYTDDENGYMLSALIDPWLSYPIIMFAKGVRYPLTWVNYPRTMGVMIKVKDEISGGITIDGKISKPMTARDRHRLNHASIVSRKILIKAGCDPDSIFVGPLRGTHPSGTVRIGEMLDTNLQTEVKNLYVCDASTFPEALDRPTVLTIIGLGKRLSDHLLNTVFRKKTARRAPAAPAER